MSTIEVVPPVSVYPMAYLLEVADDLAAGHASPIDHNPIDACPCAVADYWRGLVLRLAGIEE